MSFTMFNGEIIEAYYERERHDINSKINEIDVSNVKKIIMSDEVAENFCNIFKCINLETLIINSQHIEPEEDLEQFYGSLKNVKTLLINSEYASDIEDWVCICPNAETIMNTSGDDGPIDLDLCKNLKCLLINVSPKEMRDVNPSRTLKYVGIPSFGHEDDEYEEQYDLTLEAIKKLNLEIEIDIDDLLDNGICVYDLT